MFNFFALTEFLAPDEGGSFGGGVSEGVSEGVPSTEGMADNTNTETPTNNAEGMAGSGDVRMVPETDLNNLRATLDRNSALQRQQYEQQLMELMQFNAALQDQMDQVTYADKPDELQQVRTQRALQMEAARIQQQQQQIEPLSRIIVMNVIANQYDIPVEELRDFNDPASMEAFARKYQALAHKNKIDERVKSGVDKMEGGGSTSGAKPISQNTNIMELLTMGYKQSKKK